MSHRKAMAAGGKSESALIADARTEFGAKTNPHYTLTCRRDGGADSVQFALSRYCGACIDPDQVAVDAILWRDNAQSYGIMTAEVSV